MNIEKFTEEIANNLKSVLPAKYATAKITVQKVTKNNGTEKIGINVKSEESNMAPVIYMEKFYEKYEEGETIDSLMFEISEIIKNSTHESIDMEWFTNWEEVKNKILPRIVGRSCWNDKIMDDYIYDVVEDLCVVFVVEIDTEDLGLGHIKIKNSHMEMWGIKEDDLITQAYQNMNKTENTVFKNMFEVMKELMPGKIDDFEIEDTGLYVLTNKTKCMGASEILNREFMKNLMNHIGEDEALYLIPSSIHEWITMSEKMYNETGKEDMIKMIRTGNITQVPEEDWLSDHMYKYTKNGLEAIY